MVAINVAGGIMVFREMRLSLDRARQLATNDAPLGQFWSFSKDGASAYWGHEDHPNVFLEAVVAIPSIDWITTIRRNMNYTLGDDEQEVFLPAGIPVRLVAMHLGDEVIQGGKKLRKT